MKILPAITFALLCLAVLEAGAAPDSTGTEFREPFTLRLGVDKEHYYEEKFAKIPYVHENDVYLFKDDHFGVTFVVEKDEIVGVIYQPDISKADMLVTFSQDKVKNDLVMILKIENRTKTRLYMNALMTMPGNKSIHKTSILPVEAGLTNYESWPHPIVQLVLREVRLTKRRPNQSPVPTATSITPTADAPVPPAAGAAHL